MVSPYFLPVKLLGISFVTVIYFILGFTIAKILDFVLKEFDVNNENTKQLWQIFLEILLRLCILGILIYAARNFVSAIPFPLQGVAGFDYFRLKELNTEFIFTIPLFVFHSNFNKKLNNLYTRISK